MSSSLAILWMLDVLMFSLVVFPSGLSRTFSALKPGLKFYLLSIDFLNYYTHRIAIMAQL